MNYHLMIDDKFIDKFIKDAEVVSPNKNTYVYTFSKPTKFVTSNLGVFAPYGSEELTSIKNKIKLGDRVFVHYFHADVFNFIKDIDVNIPVYLFFWGGDFVEQSQELFDFNYEKYTKKYLLRNERFKVFSPTLNVFKKISQLKNFFKYNKKIKKALNRQYLLNKEFLQRVNFFCHWNVIDFEMIRKNYGGNFTFLPFIYDVSLSSLNIINKEIVAKKSIWLGNSDTEPNNHLDAIESLAKYNSEAIEIVCPLNYGNDFYANFIEKEINKTFPNKNYCLRNFVNFEEYTKIISEIDVVVMFHNRTQAAGNVFAFLKIGKKVFLKGQSSLYQMLIDAGCKVFDSNLIAKMTFQEFSEPLSNDDIELNHKIIDEMFSDQKRLEYLKNILN